MTRAELIAFYDKAMAYAHKQAKDYFDTAAEFDKQAKALEPGSYERFALTLKCNAAMREFRAASDTELVYVDTLRMLRNEDVLTF